MYNKTEKWQDGTGWTVFRNPLFQMLTFHDVSVTLLTTIEIPEFLFCVNFVDCLTFWTPRAFKEQQLSLFSTFSLFFPSILQEDVTNYPLLLTNWRRLDEAVRTSFTCIYKAWVKYQM